MSEKRYLRVFLTPQQWDELQVDTYYEFVRSAFFLGLPYLYIASRTKTAAYAADRMSTIESANDLGISPNDKVYKTGPVKPCS